MLLDVLFDIYVYHAEDTVSIIWQLKYCFLCSQMLLLLQISDQCSTSPTGYCLLFNCNSYTVHRSRLY